MRTLFLTLVLAVTVLTPSFADAAGPYWGRRPIYVNGEWIGYTNTYPTYTDSRAPVGVGTVTLPPAYYYDPPILVTPGYVNPAVYNSNGYYPWRGYYSNGYYGR